MFVGLLMTLQPLLMAGELREVVTKLTVISLSSKRRIPAILRSSFLIWELTLNKKKNKTQLYYKRINFPFFSSQNASHLTNNVSSKMLIYIGAEILQTA